jgi:hypothetical protein
MPEHGKAWTAGRIQLDRIESLASPAEEIVRD